MIADDFYRFRFLSIDYSSMQSHLELHWRCFLKGGRSKYDKLGAYKPGQYKPPEDFKPGLKEKR